MSLVANIILLAGIYYIGSVKSEPEWGFAK